MNLVVEPLHLLSQLLCLLQLATTSKGSEDSGDSHCIGLNAVKVHVLNKSQWSHLLKLHTMQKIPFFKRKPNEKLIFQGPIFQWCWWWFTNTKRNTSRRDSLKISNIANMQTCAMVWVDQSIPKKKLCSSYHLSTCLHIKKPDDQMGILLITYMVNVPQMVNAHIFFYIESFWCWRNERSVLEKYQSFLPQGTFLQSSRQATEAHHILPHAIWIQGQEMQDVSFSLMVLWLLLTFQSFWAIYFPW